jgi:hypothetical protein
MRNHPEISHRKEGIMKSRPWTSERIAIRIAAAAATALLLAFGAQAADKLPGDLISCLNEADQADAAHEIQRERRVLEHAETLSGDARDAARVERMLAVLDWKYDQRFDEARDRLLRAAENGAEPAEAWIALARMEQHRADYAAARDAAARGIEAARKDKEKRDAGLALDRASVAEGAELRRNGEAGDTQALRQAFGDLHEQVSREPGFLEPSRLLLSASLLLDQGDAALLAWRSYFHVAPGGPGPNAIAEAGTDLERILPGWRGAEATPAERIDLVRALAGSRFFAEAALVAFDPRADDSVRDDPRVREVVVYDRSLREVKKIAEEHYRKTILGKGDPEEFEKQVRAQASPILSAIGVDLSTPPPDEELDRLLDEHFGAYVNLGRTAGYADLHLGHRVIDETRTVEQYGRKADLRFVSLDGMVSNGFQSWAWESGAQHGGWAGPDTIWQVRPAYAGAALEVWRRMRSEEERAKFDEEVARETTLDDDRARKDPCSYLPGLAMRLQRQGNLGLLERLQGRGLTDESLRLTFLNEYERATVESSIFAHEGRHAIDQRMKTGKRPAWKSEFYAKLSEAVFTTDPRLALGGIFYANIGDPTQHGQANRHIMKGVVRWMKKHRGEIRGLDPERPLLPQFDLLTDGQIREAFRSMDPLANAG